MANQIKTRIVLRNDELANWQASEKNLLSGEVALARTTDGAVELRVGNGGTFENALRLKLSADQIVGLKNKLDEVTVSNYAGETTIDPQTATAAALAAEADRITGKTSADYKVGDSLVLREQIGETGKFQHAAYVWNGTAWEAMDGTYNADSIYFDENLTYTNAIGALAAPSGGSAQLSAAGKNLEEVLKAILAKEVKPTKVKTAPSVTATITPTGTKEVGTKITQGWSNATLNPGAYDYAPTATGVTAKSWRVSNNKTTEISTTTSGTFAEYQLSAEGDTFTTTVSANYDAAPNYAKSNIGNDTTVRVEAGSKTTTGSVTANYVYYTAQFATKKFATNDASEITAMLSSDIMEVKADGTTAAKTGWARNEWTKPSTSTGTSWGTMQQAFWVVPHGKVKSIAVKQKSPEAPHTVQMGKVKIPTANYFSDVVYDVFYIANSGAGAANKYDITVTNGTCTGPFTFGADL